MPHDRGWLASLTPLCRRSTGTRWIIQTVSLAMVLSLAVTTVATTAQAAATPTQPASTPQPATAPATAPAEGVFRLRIEPASAAAVHRAQARARLAGLFAAQQARAQRLAQQAQRAQVPASLTQAAGGTRLLPDGQVRSTRPTLTKAQQRQLVKQAKIEEARRRALAAQAEATARLQEALQALARALSTSQCHTVGGTNGQTASISCPLDTSGSTDTGTTTGTGTHDRHRHHHRQPGHGRHGGPREPGQRRHGPRRRRARQRPGRGTRPVAGRRRRHERHHRRRRRPRWADPRRDVRDPRHHRP